MHTDSGRADAVRQQAAPSDTWLGKAGPRPDHGRGR